MTTTRPKSKASLPSAIFNLCNSAIGAGILTFPYTFANSGLIFALLMSVILSLVTLITTFMLIETIETHFVDSGILALSYESLAKQMLGKRASWLLTVTIILGAFGTCAAYLIIMGGALSPVLGLALGSDHFIAQRGTLIVAIALLLCFPLSLFGKMRKLQFASLLGLIAAIYVVGFVVINSALELSAGNVDFGSLDMFTWDYVGIFKCVPMICLALTAHLQAVPIYAELRFRTRRNMFGVMTVAYILITLLYMTMGAFGYITFGRDVQGDVLQSYSASSTTANVARVVYSFVVLFSYPMQCFPCRSAIDFLVFKTYFRKCDFMQMEHRRYHPDPSHHSTALMGATDQNPLAQSLLTSSPLTQSPSVHSVQPDAVANAPPFKVDAPTGISLVVVDQRLAASSVSAASSAPHELQVIVDTPAGSARARQSLEQPKEQHEQAKLAAAESNDDERDDDAEDEDEDEDGDDDDDEDAEDNGADSANQPGNAQPPQLPTQTQGASVAKPVEELPEAPEGGQSGARRKGRDSDNPTRLVLVPLELESAAKPKPMLKQLSRRATSSYHKLHDDHHHMDHPEQHNHEHGQQQQQQQQQPAAAGQPRSISRWFLGLLDPRSASKPHVTTTGQQEQQVPPPKPKLTPEQKKERKEQKRRLKLQQKEERRQQIHEMLYRNHSPRAAWIIERFLSTRSKRFALETAVIVACTLVVALLVPDITYVLGLVGSTTMMLCIFFYPALFLWQLTKIYHRNPKACPAPGSVLYNSKFLLATAVVTFLVGAVITVLSTASFFM